MEYIIQCNLIWSFKKIIVILFTVLICPCGETASVSVQNRLGLELNQPNEAFAFYPNEVPSLQ